MKVFINCNDADWPKIRWDILDLINRRDWHGTVKLDGLSCGAPRKCPSCAAFKAHRTMRQKRAKGAVK